MVVVTSPIGDHAPPALAAIITIPAKNFRWSASEMIFRSKETITIAVVRLSRTAERKKANNLTDAQLMADAYCNEVRPYFEEIRNHCDKLELLVDDETWTLTKYRELLFTK